MSSLPKFFMIYKSHGYKFYKNKIMFLEENSFNPVNIVSPLLNASINYVSKYSSNLLQREGVMSKESSNTTYPFKWNFTGMEIRIILDRVSIIVPGIHFSECNQHILPSGSPVIVHSTSLVVWQSRAMPYLEADVIIESDSHSESSLDDIPIAPVLETMPTAPTAPTAPTELIRHIFPPHVKHLIIADSIHRNECCAITGDPISQENACITTCGHVFIKDGLTKWLEMSSSNQACPVCRQKCSLA